MGGELDLSEATIDEEEVCDGAEYDENVKDFVASEARVMSSGPFDGVENAADGVENAAEEEPKQGDPPGILVDEGDDGEAEPTESDVDSGGDFSRAVDPEPGHGDAGDGERPDEGEEDKPSGAVENGEAEWGVSAGDEGVDGAMVEFSQGDSRGDVGVDAMIEGTGKIEGEHGETEDAEPQTL